MTVGKLNITGFGGPSPRASAPIIIPSLSFVGHYPDLQISHYSEIDAIVYFVQFAPQVMCSLK
jgi:hypothetical protein